MEKRSGVVTMGGNPMTLLGKEAKVGDRAEDFLALNNDLSEFKLSDLEGKIKIISVVPSIDTGVCELQTIEFNKKAAELEDVAIVTVSMDLPFAQGRFCGAKGIDKALTVSDHKDADFGLKYGFLMEEMRLLARGLVIIDRDNTIKYVEYVAEATNPVNFEKAYEVVESLI